ncbi:MAG: hypothetical protein MI725_00065 [Pirellulales bacterium]|nr:hypothetical protein [Pirellulales bacterium]
MNRTALLTGSPESQLLTPVSDFDWFGNHQLPASSALTTSESAQCLYSPVHYEKGYAYPLIIWMHSAESNEEELWKVMPLISMRNYVAVAPRGVQCSNKVRGGFVWGQSTDDFAEARQRVRHCLELAQHRYHVHPERIYIAGYAAGGTMALRMGMEDPDLFAGALSLGGPVPRGSRPLRNINQARKLPLLLSVSPAADSYSNDQVKEDLRLLHYAGFSLSLRLYPEGDGLTTTMLSDLNHWIMESFCPSTAASS